MKAPVGFGNNVPGSRLHRSVSCSSARSLLPYLKRTSAAMFLISHFPLVSLLHQTQTSLLLSAYQQGPALSFLISVTIQFTYRQIQLMSSPIVVISPKKPSNRLAAMVAVSVFNSLEPKIGFPLASNSNGSDATQNSFRLSGEPSA
jgi:hypothetical protein